MRGIAIESTGVMLHEEMKSASYSEFVDEEYFASRHRIVCMASPDVQSQTSKTKDRRKHTTGSKY
jgi:hypothetical protein